MKWCWWVIGLGLVGFALWHYIAERKKVLASAARARQAKADKKIFENLKNETDDEFIQQTT